MDETRSVPRPDETLRAAEAPCVLPLAPPDDRKILGWSIGAAVVLHAAVMFVPFPEVETVVDEPDRGPVIEIDIWRPRPPKIERPQIVPTEIPRRVPIPDPTPAAPEPVREPERTLEPEPWAPELDVVLGEPEAPPPRGPWLPGVDDVTQPVLIEATKVRPDYPEPARAARLTGTVTLQAVIARDGTVDDIRVLGVDRPNVGFEDAAIAAVRQWRYRPATRRGRPVDVVCTIHVSFTLR